MRHGSNHTRSHKPLHGFTLVELLVVVAIIALLVSILLPALNKAKAQTLTTLCASKHRNIFWAWTHYLHDNDGRIMPAWHGWPTGEALKKGWWVLLIKSYIDKITWRADHSLPDADFTEKLWCPEKSGPMDWPLGTNPWIGMNASLDPAWGVSIEDSPPMPFFSSFRAAPSELVIFTDSRSHTYRYYSPVDISFVYRHSNNTSSNFIMADGHVELTWTRASIDVLPADGIDDAYPPGQYAYYPMQSELGHPRGDNWSQ